jgi:hypothetical protein
MVGPYRVLKRQGRFEVHDGRAVLSRHGNFLDAEEAALCTWLQNSHNDDEEPDSSGRKIAHASSMAAPTSGGSGGEG